MDRRNVLSCVAAGLSLPTVGCLSEAEGFDPNIDRVTRIGTADPVSTEAEPRKRFEYLEEEDRVRYETDDEETEEVSFEVWGTRRATIAATIYVEALLRDEDLFGSGIVVEDSLVKLDEIESGGAESPSESEFDRAEPRAAEVSHVTQFSKRGELMFEPEADFEALVEGVPRSIEITMQFDVREYTAVVPGVCTRDWVQES